MSRTYKPRGRQWHRPDGWHVSMRLDRKARSAGRIKRIVQREQDADAVEAVTDHREPEVNRSHPCQ